MLPPLFNKEDMISRGLSGTKSFMDAPVVGLYHVIPLMNMAVKPHGILSSTSVKMVANHMMGVILLKSSAKMAASHMVIYPMVNPPFLKK